MNDYILHKELSYEIIGACMKVYDFLGPAFNEIVYKDALCIELVNAGIPFEVEKLLEVDYKGTILLHKFKVDILVDETIILELKAVKEITEIHYAQIFNYLRVSNKSLGIIINFGELKLVSKRVVL
jgi:GxxExxY protein